MQNVKMITPWFFGERLEHVKVNGWRLETVNSRSGSVASRQSESVAELQSESEIDSIALTDESSLGLQNDTYVDVMIVFWPQYLEWVGFLVLGVGGITILFWPRKRVG